MRFNTRVFFVLVFALAVLASCSSAPPASEAKKAQIPLDKIQGRIQVLVDNSGGTGDAALNPGGAAVYLWVGPQRFRLFSRTLMEVTHGKDYVVEGVNAQKVIDEIGDWRARISRSQAEVCYMSPRIVSACITAAIRRAA